MDKYLNFKRVTPEMLFCDSIAVDDQRVWLVSIGHNVLFEIERETGLVSPCGLISNNKENKISYRFLFKHEEKIILLPYEEKNLCVYDIEKKKFEYIELNIMKLEKNDTWKFTGHKKIGNKIVIYGLNSTIIIITLPTFEITYLNLKKYLPSNVNIECWFWDYSYSIEDKLFLVPVTHPCIVELDVNLNSVKFNKISGENIICIDNPVFNKEFLYYINRKKTGNVSLIKYDIKSGENEKCDLGIDKVHDYKTFGFIACANNELWMLPGACSEGFRFYISEGIIEKLNDLPVIPGEKLENYFPYEFNYRNGLLDRSGHILTIHAWTCKLIDIDTSEGTIRVIPLYRNNDECWLKLMDEVYNDCSCGIHSEWMEGMLEAYLDKVVVDRKVIVNESRSNIGKYIYQEIS